MINFINTYNVALFDNIKKPEDVSILVGVNGSGKSSYLNEIAKYYIKQNKTVIAIANTVYDKFTFKGKNAKILKSSRGRNTAKNAIKEVIKMFNSENSNTFFRLSTVFHYIKFTPSIEIKIKKFDINYREKIIKSDFIERNEKEELIFLLDRFNERFIINNEGFFTLNFDDKVAIYKNLYLLKILDFESKLKRIKILGDIEISLNKKGQKFLLNNASSGELSIIASLMFVSANIDNNTVILIDEPENSLHPKWQVEYVKNLFDLFYYFEPKVIIATHSPLIINGAEINISSTNIFKGISFNHFVKQERDLINVEEIYEDYFDVTTPENRYLSQNLIDKMNLLASRDISLDKFTEEINIIQDNSYDDKQKTLLDEVLQMGKKILNDIE